MSAEIPQATSLCLGDFVERTTRVGNRSRSLSTGSMSSPTLADLPDSSVRLTPLICNDPVTRRDFSLITATVDSELPGLSVKPCLVRRPSASTKTPPIPPAATTTDINNLNDDQSDLLPACAAARDNQTTTERVSLFTLPPTLTEKAVNRWSDERREEPLNQTASSNSHDTPSATHISSNRFFDPHSVEQQHLLSSDRESMEECSNGANTAIPHDTQTNGHTQQPAIDTDHAPHPPPPSNAIFRSNTTSTASSSRFSSSYLSDEDDDDAEEPARAGVLSKAFTNGRIQHDEIDTAIAATTTDSDIDGPSGQGIIPIDLLNSTGEEVDGCDCRITGTTDEHGEVESGYGASLSSSCTRICRASAASNRRDKRRHNKRRVAHRLPSDDGLEPGPLDVHESTDHQPELQAHRPLNGRGDKTGQHRHKRNRVRILDDSSNSPVQRGLPHHPSRDAISLNGSRSGSDEGNTPGTSSARHQSISLTSSTGAGLSRLTHRYSLDEGVVPGSLVHTTVSSGEGYRNEEEEDDRDYDHAIQNPTHEVSDSYSPDPNTIGLAPGASMPPPADAVPSASILVSTANSVNSPGYASDTPPIYASPGHTVLASTNDPQPLSCDLTCLSSDLAPTACMDCPEHNWPTSSVPGTPATDRTSSDAPFRVRSGLRHSTTDVPSIPVSCMHSRHSQDYHPRAFTAIGCRRQQQQPPPLQLQQQNPQSNGLRTDELAEDADIEELQTLVNPLDNTNYYYCPNQSSNTPPPSTPGRTQNPMAFGSRCRSQAGSPPPPVMLATANGASAHRTSSSSTGGGGWGWWWWSHEDHHHHHQRHHYPYRASGLASSGGGHCGGSSSAFGGRSHSAMEQRRYSAPAEPYYEVNLATPAGIRSPGDSRAAGPSRVGLIVDNVRFVIDTERLQAHPDTMLGRMFGTQFAEATLLNNHYNNRRNRRRSARFDRHLQSPGSSTERANGGDGDDDDDLNNTNRHEPRAATRATSSTPPVDAWYPATSNMTNHSPNDSRTPDILLAQNSPISAQLFQTLLDYYLVGHVTCPPGITVPELKAACDYFLIPFNHKTIRCANLRALLHELTNDGARHMFDQFLESDILPLLVTCAEQGDRECHVVILTGDEPIEWDQQYPPQMPDNELSSHRIRNRHMFRFLKYIENREVAKQVLLERGLKKIRIGIEGYPTCKDRMKIRPGSRPEAIYNYVQCPFLRMSWEEEENKSRHVDFQCVKSKSVSDLTSGLEQAIVDPLPPHLAAAARGAAEDGGAPRPSEYMVEDATAEILMLNFSPDTGDVGPLAAELSPLAQLVTEDPQAGDPPMLLGQRRTVDYTFSIEMEPQSGGTSPT